MARATLSTLLIVLSILLAVQSQETKENEYFNRVFSSYNSRVSPSDDDRRPVEVTIQLHVHRFSPGDKQGRGDTYVTLRESWTDPRLAYRGFGITKQYISLNRGSTHPVHKIWSPDTFIVNADAENADGHKLTRVDIDGRVDASTRIKADLICPSANWHRLFPLDTQHCNLDISSYSHPDDEIVYKWSPVPIQLADEIDAETFEFEKAIAASCSPKETATGRYSCIRAEFHFKRDWLFFVTRYYVPTGVIVMLSWLVFWLTPKHAIAARVGIGLFCTAALLAFYGAISYMILPSRTSATALDIWSWICLAFIVLSLLETVLAHVLRKSEHQHAHRLTYDDDERHLINEASSKRKRATTRSRVLDCVASILFPLGFIAFVVVYWVVYLLL